MEKILIKLLNFLLILLAFVLIIATLFQIFNPINLVVQILGVIFFWTVFSIFIVIGILTLMEKRNK